MTFHPTFPQIQLIIYRPVSPESILAARYLDKLSQSSILDFLPYLPVMLAEYKPSTSWIFQCISRCLSNFISLIPASTFFLMSPQPLHLLRYFHYLHLTVYENNCFVSLIWFFSTNISSSSLLIYCSFNAFISLSHATCILHADVEIILIEI